MGYSDFKAFGYSRSTAVLCVAPSSDFGGARRACSNVDLRGAAPRAGNATFTLVGTIVGGDSRIAILFDETSKITSGVREGERSGWTLRSVYPRSATLEESGRVVTLALPEPSGEIGPPPTPVSAPPTVGKRRSSQFRRALLSQERLDLLRVARAEAGARRRLAPATIEGCRDAS